MKRSHHLLEAMTVSLIATASLGLDVTPDSIQDDQVQAARKAIIEMIWQHQDPKRHWDPIKMPSGESTNQHFGGYTALACLALITAGESYQDPRLERPIADLEEAELKGTYAVATRAAIWAELPDRFHPLLQRDTQWLLNSYNRSAAGWDYKANPTRKLTRPSPSVRHFGTLALWAASRRGLSTPPALLGSLESVTIENQLPDGSWHYPSTGQSRGSGSMTAAGLVTLYITQELLHAQEALRLSDRKPTPVESAIERGLVWMDENYDAERNPGGGRGSKFPMYYQYAVERVGLASGLRTFDGHDWFREGSAAIFDRLFEDHPEEFILKTSYAPDGKPSALRELCFSLLFLSRGRHPIGINKLQFDDGRWNNRPRDVANLCRWMSDEMETPVNWQVVSIDSEPESWLDAPILFIASDKALPWLESHRDAVRDFISGSNDYLQRRADGTLQAGERAPRPPRIAEAEALRRYINRGGLVIAVNEGRSQAFNRSMQDLGSMLYPRGTWNTLPSDHVLYQSPLKVTGTRPKILALDNGVREQILLFPSSDITADLQVVKRSSKPVMHTLSNIHAHASGMHRTQPRLDAGARTYEDPRGTTTASLVRGVHGGHWKAEPEAFKALQESMGREHDVHLVVRDRLIEELDRSGRPDLVVISGTSNRGIGEPAWEAIERYVRDDHGVVLFEHVGGGGAFAARAEQDAMDRFQIPARSASSTSVITGKGLDGGVDCSSIRWTPYTVMEILGGRETAPRLRCMHVDGRPSLFFSREDISHALLDQPRWDIDGYAHDSAKGLASNLVLHSMQQRPAATPDTP